jgi:acetyltransferase-like isoleucine patch superfamily enzyme
MEHPYEDMSTSTFLTDNSKRVLTEVGHDVWIAAGAIIKTGVKIGNGAVVGANSFVNKDVPPYAIVIGTPAKVYKYRFDEKTIAELEKSQYWEQKPSKARQNLLEINSNPKK